MTLHLHEEDRFCTLKDSASDAEITLCYRVYGSECEGTVEPTTRPPHEPTLVLIAGLTHQLHYWPTSLIKSLLQAGYQILVLDNRDVGRSSRHHSAPLTLKHLLLSKGRPEGYVLLDMAADVIGLMDHLHIQEAHILGMSMGGMIAQELAAHWPNRVLSLTSMISSTGCRKVGQLSFGAKLRMLKARKQNRVQWIQNFVDHAHFIAGKRYAVDEFAAKDYAAKAWDRGDGANAGAGAFRQIGAIFNSGDRTPNLRKIKAATLVIHGDKDPLVSTTGAYATADAIPNSKLVIVPGMGHYISPEVAPMLADLIVGHTKKGTCSNEGLHG
ncbi:MAG: alpha/beta hydrolase [Limnobacter sp.]|nr:alpha/beta hydrolase [Limnobacter sp.]